jgi:hypothetical protein
MPLATSPIVVIDFVIDLLLLLIAFMNFQLLRLLCFYFDIQK